MVFLVFANIAKEHDFLLVSLMSISIFPANREKSGIFLIFV